MLSHASPRASSQYGCRSRVSLGLVLHRLRAFDRKFPMTPKPVERIKHGLCLSGADAAATHGVVEHAVAILPWSFVFSICDIMQYGSVPVFSFKRPAHDGPEVSRYRCAVDN